ncbi:unnamed protein product, partial [Allacma fusca]
MGIRSSIRSASSRTKYFTEAMFKTPSSKNC